MPVTDDIIFISLKRNKSANRGGEGLRMKKELGKWLMDIAKYITTAVILNAIFNGIREKRIFYVIGISAIVITIVSGLILIGKKVKED